MELLYSGMECAIVEAVLQSNKSRMWLIYIETSSVSVEWCLVKPDWCLLGTESQEW